MAEKNKKGIYSVDVNLKNNKTATQIKVLVVENGLGIDKFLPLLKEHMELTISETTNTPVQVTSIEKKKLRYGGVLYCSVERAEELKADNKRRGEKIKRG